HFESLMNQDGTDLRVSRGAADDLQWQMTNLSSQTSTERIGSPQLSKQLDYVNARGAVDLQYTLQSQALGGQVAVTTTAGGVSGWIGRLPDTGSIRVAAPGHGSVSLSTQSTEGSRNADLAVDGDGNGMADTTTELAWDQAARGFLWWAQGLVELRPGVGYNIPPTGTPGLLRYDIGPTDGLALDTVFDWTFSIPLDATQMPELVLQREASGAPLDPGLERVALASHLRGARLTLTPANLLEPGRTYHLAMLNRSDPAGPTLVPELNDTLQRTIVLFDTFTTR
ncbi:MAG TPA: hypothetical protein VE029_02860, partial [Rhizobacter sp.]|nr:hypothetical protein [Rhizobacter sp.]